MPQSYTTSVQGYGKGVNDYHRPDQINNAQSPATLRNVRGDADWKRPRSGYLPFINEVVGTSIAAIGPYLRRFDSEDRVIMVGTNNTIYSYRPGTDTSWQVVNNSLLTNTDTVDISHWGDFCFILNGVDQPVLINNTTASQPFTPPDSLNVNTFLPAFGDFFQGHFFVAGVPTAPNILFYSKIATDVDPGNIYAFDGAASNYGDSGMISFPDRITAVKYFNGSLIVFTISSAFFVPSYREFGTVIVYEALPISGSSGAVNQASTVIVENDIYYLTPQKEVRSLRRGESDSLFLLSTPLSRNIQRFLNTEISDDLSLSFGYYDRPRKYFKLYLRSQSGVFNDTRIVGDINQLDETGAPEWFIDDPMIFSCGTYYQSGNFSLSLIGSPLTGRVYEDEVGTSDDGANIRAFWSTKTFNQNNPNNQKNYREVTVFGEITESTEILATVYVDDIAVHSVIIDDDDITHVGHGLVGGIGTDPIADFPIAMEGESSAGAFGSLREFTKRITFRQKGKNVRVEFLTDGVNQNYAISQSDITFIPLSKHYNPIKEK